MIRGTVTPPTEEEVIEICKIINTALGFNYSSQKRYLIESRLNKRLTKIGFTNYRDYLLFLREDPGELSKLLELLTTNVTSFFRESAQFEFLAKTLLPQIKTKVPKKLRCWSAGCSSGEEPYSLAITCRENLGPDWDIKVLATDVNTEKLQHGRTGVYTREQIESVPPGCRHKYLKPLDKENFQVVPELRDMVVFRLMNLLEDTAIPEHIRVNIIFCRNVFIYLSQEARRKILNHFYLRLTDGGYLFLGHSESINTSVDTRWVSLGNAIYQKR